MAYCTEGDLMAGDIPSNPGTKSQYINAASDEMDSYLSAWYVTPISVNENDPRYRRTTLTMKRICSQLASGRLITSMATGGQDTEVHAYGLMLISQALEALKQLATGSPDLPGAVKHSGDDDGKSVKESDLRGKVFNGDSHSEVDAFYGQTAPGGFFSPAPSGG